ncbi:uncharacterized protein LOC113492293 [Trichoplusia ni]|uniref:Uncharacterized protein LOC113492293 n=1 Tax=Trichoplusia ni TaxID=7111 RepID=A0A7E5VB78_TRINI|nr:uncharacterized protein LOC113492293 [Trichoplusia ni]XP_026725536.1 uncharacterized protein LOC113492293 [Trichoplusia ni]
MSGKKYKKRQGTSGIRGQLYESKLISLIYFRAKHAASVGDFLLATNMDEVGAFDDICLRVKLKGVEKPLIVFVQAKHRENDNSVLTLSKHDLTHYFYSYLNIRRTFSPHAKGELFEGTYDATECLFVMYTTAKAPDDSQPYESPAAKHLNALIATGKSGIRPPYNQTHVDFLSDIVIQEQVAMLAGQLAKFLSDDDEGVLSMNNDLMLCYHVLLAQRVLDVSRIQRRGEESEHRLAHFRHDFFTASDDFLKLFRDTLVLQILKNQTLEEDKVNVLLTSLFTEPFDILVLSELIECVVTYRQGKLHFLHEIDEELKQQLFKINVSQATVERALEMAAQRILIRKTFKVPVTFGNSDLTIRGKLDVDVEQVLNELSSKIVGLLRDSDPHNVVLDESLGSEFLQLNQGIASAVGNVLVRGDNENSLKFTDEPEALGDLAKRLYDKVRQEIPDLNPYKFVVKTKQLPLLSFDIIEDGINMEVHQEITVLAVTMARFLNEEVGLSSLMDDELVLRYHVVLEQKAIEVYEIQQQHEDGEHRIASFRQDLFGSDEEVLQLFRRTLYLETAKRRKIETSEISSLLSAFYKDTSDISSLSQLIGSVVTYESGKLQFVHETSKDLEEQLGRVNVTQSTVDQAIELAAREILTQVHFQVPAAFGNKDLTIKGRKGLKIERRLTHLNMKISELNILKIVTIDDSFEDKLLREGLASAVGNILVVDKETNLLKFVDEENSLGRLSGMWFQRLRSQIPDMQQYRFDVKVHWLPKLSYSSGDEDNSHSEKAEMSALAEVVANCISDGTDCVLSMDDERLLLYHVILAEQAFNISDIQSDDVSAHRIASFRKDFFDTNDQLMKLFRDKLYVEVIKRRKLEETDLQTAITTFRQFPDDVTLLSKLLGNVITVRHGKVQVVYDMSEDLTKPLNKVSVSQLKVNQAIELAAKEILVSKQFNVPTEFGNKDLTLRAKSSHVAKVLNHLTMRMCRLVNSPDVVKMATIDESLGDGLLKPSGGIGGLVGNLLVQDEDTKLLKFTDNSETLGELSKRLFNKLQNNKHDLRQYRFIVKAKRFPKLTFDSSEHDRRLVEDFLNRLLYFTSQADETRVGDILRGDIEDNICRRVNNFRVTSDALFLTFHDEIQTWWMAAEGDYLTKKSKKYEIASKKIVSKPLMTVLGMMHQTKLGNNIECSFKDKVISALKLTSGAVVVTNSADLTVAKMIQRYKSQEHVVLDLAYMLNLQANEYNTLCEELRDTDESKVLVVVCNHKPSHRNWSSRLRNIAEAVRNKFTVVVTNRDLVPFIREYFGNMSDVIDDGVVNLADLTAESQKSVLKNATAVFQGQEVRLELILDEESMRYVKGEVLNKVINNEVITVSKLVSSLNYEKIKQVFIDREVYRSGDRKRTVLNSLSDLSDDVVILTAQPGMGKSTMLTYLSHKAKENDPNLWIVRVNLLDHSEQFNNWKDHETDIDVSESLRFLCEVVLSGDPVSDQPAVIELEESGGFMYLRHCAGDESTAFELQMFLHYYNTKNVMFLFDGFDEICPHYAQEAMALFKTVKSFPRRHKMWITSRSYDEVKSILELEFGTSFELQNFSPSDRNRYLNVFWEKKIVLSQLTNIQMNNLIEFMKCVAGIYQEKPRKRLKHKLLYYKVCMSFRDYLKREIHKCPERIIEKFHEALNNCKYNIMFLDNFDSPLHLYLVADYLRNQILHYNEIDNNWNLNDNALTIYERFFEAKLKWIRFEEKNKIHLTNSDNIIIYEHIREDFFKRHRQLGAYAIFHQDAESIFSLKEMREIIDSMTRIKAGKEKTGVICGVSNDVPIFIHMIFAEYFAVQHLCLIILLEKETEKQRKIWDFILNVIFLKSSQNVRDLLDYRIQVDNNLKEIIKESEFIIFDLLLKQGKGIFTYYEEDVSEELYLKIKAYLKKAMDDDLMSFINYLYKIKRKLTDEYLADNSRIPSRFRRYKMNALIHKKKNTLAQPDVDEPSS